MAHIRISACNTFFRSIPSKHIVGIVAIFLLAGCSESNRCLGRKVPQLDTVTLNKAILNQVYTQVIRASVKNSVEDDLYRYSYSLIGDLPPGISIRQDDRRFIFEGTPTVQGEYPMELTVRLGNENNLIASADVNELCRRSETVAYNLEVSL